MNAPVSMPYPAASSRTDLDTRALAGELSQIVGRERVHAGVAARRRHPGDMSWLTYVHAHFGRSLACQDVAVAATSTRDVSEIMRLASRLGVPVTPVGGASGVQGAANANCGGILLDLRAMKQVRHLDRTSLTCTVEAGMIVRDFEDWLNAQGLSFTHYPASAEWASIGGSVAARGSGVLSTKYGTIQDHLLSAEFVLPQGDVVQLPPIPRHGVGPDLTQLLSGSEGTLGVLTAVTVRLRLLPAHRRFAAFRFDNLGRGIEAGRRIMTEGLRPAVMRLYDAHAAVKSLERAVHAGLDGETMLIMVDGHHERLVADEAALCSEICLELGARSLGAEVGGAWWKNRYAFYHPPHAPQLPQIWMTLDAAADYAHIQAVYDAVTGAIHGAADPRWGLTLKTHLSHWYEWGSMIYPRVVIPEGPDNLDEALALHDSIVRAATLAALEAGGVINDHHGVGLRLAPYLEQQFGTTGMSMLRQIKAAIDPGQVLSPGKLGL
ncbi:MAG: FAD-binding oxidoreductase [Burkholderiaceae bacterium]